MRSIRIEYERMSSFDENGNELRYRSVVEPATGSRVHRVLYDVWLVTED